MKRPLTIGILTVAIVVIAWALLGPARKSEAGIQKSLLAQTPIGSQMIQVRMLAEKKGWVGPVVTMNGYMVFPPGRKGVDIIAFSGQVEQDPFPYRTRVMATWEFDRNNRLVRIQVHRVKNE